MEAPMTVTITMPRDAAEATLKALRDLVADEAKDIELVPTLKAAAAVKAALEEAER